MSKEKSDIIRATLCAGLASANRGNPFWSKSDAMQALAINKQVRAK